MDVKTKLIDALSAFGYPVFLQGTLSEDTPYPASFFTFWNNATDSADFYDNAENAILWDFDLNFYSDDPMAVNETLLAAKALLKSAGFIVNGVGYDVISDEPTHTGRGLNLLYIEKQKEG